MCYRRARGGAPLTPRADRETGASPLARRFAMC